MKIKSPEVFISHAHENVGIATTLKVRLHSFGVSSFVAHQDIDTSSKWEKEILKAIKRCDCMVPLFSKPFRDSKSRWPDHEVGMARILDMFVYPISLDDVTPYGSIAGIQGKKIKNPESEREWHSVVLDLCHRLIDKDVLRKAWVIKSFAESNHFHEANSRAELLGYVEKKHHFHSYDLSKIVTAALNNDQIMNSSSSTDAAEYVIGLSERHKKQISRNLLLALEKKKDMLQWRKQ